MSKTIYFICFSFVSFCAVISQSPPPTVDPTKAFNALNKSISKDCQALVAKSIEGKKCDDLSKKLNPDPNLMKQMEEAGERGNTAKMNELIAYMMKKSCCGGFDMMDCMKDIIIKNCNTNDQAGFTKALGNVTDLMANTYCSKYKYHSSGCGYKIPVKSTTAPVLKIKTDIDPNTLIPGSNANVSKACQTKIQAGGAKCAQILLKRVLEASQNSDTSNIVSIIQKASCCGSWDVMDCGRDLAKQCNSTEQNFMNKAFANGTQILEKSTCSQYKYHSSECSGTCTITTNLAFVALFVLSINKLLN